MREEDRYELALVREELRATAEAARDLAAALREVVGMPASLIQETAKTANKPLQRGRVVPIVRERGA
jgi:hypothetical protein